MHTKYQLQKRLLSCSRTAHPLWKPVADSTGLSALWVIAGVALLVLFIGLPLFFHSTGPPKPGLGPRSGPPAPPSALKKPTPKKPAPKHKVQGLVNSGKPGEKATRKADRPKDLSAKSKGRKVEAGKKSKVPDPALQTVSKGAQTTPRKSPPEKQKGTAEHQPPKAKTKINKRLFVQVDVGNIRRKPTLKSKVLFQMRRGGEVTATRQRGEWYAVKLKDGRSGWGHHSLFSESPPPQDLQKKDTLKEGPKKGAGSETPTIIKAIRSIPSSTDTTRIIFELNGFFIPQTSVIEGQQPRIVCDFLNARVDDNIAPITAISDNNIRNIRIGVHENPRKVRVVIDLADTRNYTVEQIFFKRENYFSLVIKPKT